MSYFADKTETLIAAGSASSSGRYTQISSCDMLTMTVVLSVSAATLQGTIALGCTNDDPEVSAFPAMTGGTAITAMPTGFTYSSSTGLITLNNPSVGISEMTVSYTQFTKWIRASYTYTSGGGSVDLKVITSAWSV